MAGASDLAGNHPFSALNAQRSVDEANDQRFKRYGEQVDQEITSRLATYIGLLKGEPAFFRRLSRLRATNGSGMSRA